MRSLQTDMTAVWMMWRKKYTQEICSSGINMKQKVELNNKTILVTGSPGFIGANLVLRLIKELDKATIVSFDNMNSYYDPALKEYRLGLIEEATGKAFEGGQTIFADAPLERIPVFIKKYLFFKLLEF